MKVTRLSISLLFGAGVIAAACGTSAPGYEESPSPSGPSGPAPISWEEFRASVYREPGPNGVFIVDGDIPLQDEQALRAYYDSWGSAPGALTISRVGGVNERWPFPAQFALTYCIGSSLGSNKPATVTAMQQATEAWERLVAVNFIYVPAQDANCTASNTNVVFDVNLAPSDADYTARAFLPSFTRSVRNLLIHTSAFGPLTLGTDLQGVLMHELGHALGYLHEHIRLSPSCTSEGIGDVTFATPYDANSVMHYPQCRTPQGGGFRISLLDYKGAVTHYGLSPALIAAL